MFQLECETCGAIFITEEETVPACLECSCQGKQFKVCKPMMS